MSSKKGNNSPSDHGHKQITRGSHSKAPSPPKRQKRLLNKETEEMESEIHEAQKVKVPPISTNVL